ncbi:MAG: chorismate mutase [Neisseria sp.]|nr:chorismate mutase [Neisseria sp.]
MIIVMKRQARAQDVAAVVDFIRAKGLREHVSVGQERTIIGAVGDERVFLPQELERLPQVERAVRVLDDWRIISRETQPQDCTVAVRGRTFGGGSVLDIASDAARAEEADAVYLDPFFVENNPYAAAVRLSEKEQIKAMREAVSAVHRTGRPVLLRLRDARQLPSVLDAAADILYLGGGMIGNRALLDEIGRLNTPVVLCKDKHHSYRDWLTAAEHVALKGNQQIILGEAGTLNPNADFPYRLDTEALVRVKQICRLPVLADISGLWHNHMPQEILRRLATAAGADAVIGG